MGESALFNGKHSIANQYFMDILLLTCCDDTVLLWRALLMCQTVERAFLLTADQTVTRQKCSCHTTGLFLDIFDQASTC